MKMHLLPKFWVDILFYFWRAMKKTWFRNKGLCSFFRHATCKQIINGIRGTCYMEPAKWNLQVVNIKLVTTQTLPNSNWLLKFGLQQKSTKWVLYSLDFALSPFEIELARLLQTTIKRLLWNVKLKFVFVWYGIPSQLAENNVCLSMLRKFVWHYTSLNI